MAESPGSVGQIRLLLEASGQEIVVATASAYGAQYSALGPYRVVGDLVETDTGVVGISIAGGALRVSGNNEDGAGIAIATEIILSPALNGPIVIEARVQGQALTTRNWFIGICGTLADNVAEPIQATGTTLTLTAANLAGFLLNSELTAGTEWHMPYNGGSVTGPTNSNSVDSDVVAVAAEWDVLRLEVYPNGTVKWFINGVLEQEVANAVSTTALQAALVETAFATSC